MTSALKWSDMNDDEYNTEDIEGFVKIEGDIKISTQFVDQAEGLLKVITRSKIHKRIDRESKTTSLMKKRMIEERTARGKKDDTTSAQAEECFIELPRKLKKIDDDDIDDGPTDHVTTSGLPFMKKDGVRDKFLQIRRLDGTTDTYVRDDEGLMVESEEKLEKSDRFQAPRGKVGGDGKDDSTVRVTNLSEETQEHDLKELFGTMGKISRIYLAKNKETQSSKGFAFITYDSKSSAEKAIAKLDRHGYDSLLLKVEWAKPSPTKPRD